MNMDQSLTQNSYSTRVSIFLVTILFSFSSLVLIEPAPFDMLFFPVAAIILVALKQDSFSRLSFPSYVMLFSFVMVGAFSIWIAPKVPRAIVYHSVTIYLCFLSLFVCFISQAREIGYLKAVIRGFTIGVTVAGIFGVLAFYHLLVPHELFTKFGRVAGTYKDPNVFGPAAVLALNLILFLPIFQTNAGGKKVQDLLIRAFMALVLSLAIVLSFSRAAIALLILSLVLNVGILLFMKQIQIKAWHGILFVIFCFSLVVVAPFLIDVEFLLHRLQVHEYDNNRFDVQSKAIGEALGSVFGRGPGQSEILFLKYADTQNTGAIHNSYVRILVENGWIALVMFVGYIFTALLLGAIGILKVRIQKQARNSTGFDSHSWRVSCLAIVFTASALHTPLGIVIDTIHWRHFYVIFGMMIGLACHFMSKPDQQ